MRSTFYLEAYARFNGKGARLKVGEYALAPGMTPRDLLERIATGQVIQYPLTVVEGWTFSNYDRHWRRIPRSQTWGIERCRDHGALGSTGAASRGLVFPDTYHFPAGFTDEAFLRRALMEMGSV